MSQPVSLLIVDDEADLVRAISAGARERAYHVRTAESVRDALDALSSSIFDVVLVDPAIDPDCDRDVIGAALQRAADTEVVVMSAMTSLAFAMPSSREPSAFAFLQKPFDVEHLFVTVEKAIERRRAHGDHRRLVWELQTINATFDAISDAIAVFDGDGRLLRGNAALGALLGRSAGELRGMSCHEIGLCGGSCPACAVGRALAGEGGHAEVSLPRDQIFSVTTWPVGGGGGGASVVQAAKNVTEEIHSARRLRQLSEELALANAQQVAALDQLKSTQAQLLQAEKLSAIGQLVAGVAHELNNPLTSVMGYAQLLESELLDTRQGVELRSSEELAQDLRRIAEESERAARIVRNLLAFARRQTAARVPQDLADLAARVLALREYEFRLSGIELRTNFETGLPPVVGDGGQLQQALLNLVLNAEQAMRARPVRRLAVSARYDEMAAAIELRLADTGHGIDESNLTRIFDPFFTTREVGEGTGLGLSICYGIVRGHGGEIAVDSRVQEGTTFRLLLPARVEDPASAREQILVANMEQGDRDFVAAALAAWGHPVEVIGTAGEALARYRRGGLQAVLIDRALLEGDLQGWRAARTADGRRVPLILMTVAADDTDVERFAREQASAVLVPPFQLRGLRSAVRAVCKECV